MADNFIMHTPKSNGVKKFFLFLILSLIGLFGMLFISKFVSTLWTIKYGSQEAKQALDERINPSFTVSPVATLNQRAKSSKIEAKELIRSHNPTFGAPEAPVKIIAFIDFECPYCQQSYPIFKSVMEQYGDVVQVVFKHFPIGAIHPQALESAVASTCADEQGKFWEYHNLLFTKKVLDTTSLVNYADTIGLDAQKFRSCLTSEKYIASIEQDMQDGADAGVRGTPTFIIESKKVEGVIDTQLWQQVIVDALQKKK